MTLEDLTGSSKYISDLDNANPAGIDPKSQGDDHVRGIKNVLKNTFPNVNAAVSPSDEELNYSVGATSNIQTQLDTLTTSSAFQATEGAIGKAELATQAEADAGTDDLRIVTPLKLVGFVDSHRFVSAEQTITAAGLLTIPHGLGVKPFSVTTTLVCKVADAGYSIGDEVVWESIQILAAFASRGASITIDATNLTIRFGVTNPTYTVLNKATGATVNIVNTSWKLKVYAQA